MYLNVIELISIGFHLTFFSLLYMLNPLRISCRTWLRKPFWQALAAASMQSVAEAACKVKKETNG